METDFVTWIIDEMNQRGWNNSDLARRANLVPSTISMLISQQKRPGIDACNGIARAFKVPAERVFRIAGILPARIIGEDNATKETELLDYFRALDPDSQKTILTLARALHEQNVDRDQNS
jgi:transcriptional regulator with XRE-family HTH domain